MLVCILIYGCTRRMPVPLEQPARAGAPESAPVGAQTIAPDPTSPDANQVNIYAMLPDAVQGGRVWVMVGPIDNLPGAIVGSWRVGLTDSSQRTYVLGQLSQAQTEMGLFIYTIPEAASAGKGRLWLGATENPEASGTVGSLINILPYYGLVANSTLSVQFVQPKGWRLHNSSDIIILTNGPQEPAQPYEEIDVQKKLVKWPDYSTVLETEQVTVAGWPAVRTYLQRQTANATAGWLETHTVVRDIDVVLAYRPPLTAEMTDAYAQILDSLSFQ